MISTALCRALTRTFFAGPAILIGIGEQTPNADDYFADFSDPIGGSIAPICDVIRSYPSGRRCWVATGEERRKRQFGEHDQLHATLVRPLHQPDHAIYRHPAPLGFVNRPSWVAATVRLRDIAALLFNANHAGSICAENRPPRCPWPPRRRRSPTGSCR